MCLLTPSFFDNYYTYTASLMILVQLILRGNVLICVRFNFFYFYSDLDKLSDMFPKASLDHITKCLTQAKGNMNTAVELLLMDCQSSQVV